MRKNFLTLIKKTSLLAIVVSLFSCEAKQAKSLKAEVVKEYYHNKECFTQGLVYENDFIYESGGLYGKSSLAKRSLTNEYNTKYIPIAPVYFTEGIAILNDKIYQITWKEQTVFVYDKKTFKKINTLSYEGEGWGITTDGKNLIMSDGTDKLYFRDEDTFEIKRIIEVVDGKRKVNMLNELEYIEGKVYANVWQTRDIAIINPKSGRVEAWVDAKSLEAKNEKSDVLNGIAYDKENKRIFVTGKLWAVMYEIKIGEVKYGN